MAPIKKKKQPKKDAKKPKTFLELKSKKGSEVLKRLKSREMEAMRRDELKTLQEKKAELEAQAIRSAKTTREKEMKAIQEFRKENPNISQSAFSKLVKKEYDIDIGLMEPLSKVELADAKRRQAEQEELRKQAAPRRDDAAIAEAQRLKQERELAKIVEKGRIAREQGQRAAESERIRIETKSRLAAAEAERMTAATRRKLEAEQEVVRRKVAEQEPIVEAAKRKRDAEKALKERAKLAKELEEELTRYGTKQKRLTETLADARRKYDKAFRAFEKRVAGKQEANYTQAEKDAAAKLDIRDKALDKLTNEIGTLDRALEVISFNKKLADGARPLDQLKEMEGDDAKELGLSLIGQRVVKVRAAKAAAAAGAQQPEEEEEEEEEEDLGQAGVPPAAAAAAAAPVVQALAQPPQPANIVVVPPNQNANNANALANANPAAVQNLNAQPAGTGLMRHLSIHPSHITETAKSYKLKGKGLKHAQMLMKYLPNHAKKIIAFSILNKARNKIHKLDKKRIPKARGGGIADQLEQGLFDGLAEGFMSLLD